MIFFSFSSLDYWLKKSFLLLGKFFFYAIQETLLSSLIANQICSVLSVLRIKTIGTTFPA